MLTPPSPSISLSLSPPHLRSHPFSDGSASFLPRLGREKIHTHTHSMYSILQEKLAAMARVQVRTPRRLFCAVVLVCNSVGLCLNVFFFVFQCTWLRLFRHSCFFFCSLLLLFDLFICYLCCVCVVLPFTVLSLFGRRLPFEASPISFARDIFPSTVLSQLGDGVLCCSGAHPTARSCCLWLLWAQGLIMGFRR